MSAAPPPAALAEMKLMALERELDEADVDAAMDSGEPKAALVRLLSQTATAPASSEAARIVAALAGGGASEREVAYATLEGVVRGAPPSGSGKEQAVALAVACARPLVSVLCAPAIAAVEYQRAAVLLFEMTKLDIVAVCGDTYRVGETGSAAILSTYTAPDTVFAAMCAKDPCEWAREEALITAANGAAWVHAWGVGWTAVLAEAEVEDEMPFPAEWMEKCPFSAPSNSEKFVLLGLLLLDFVRSQADEQPEGVIAGAWFCLNQSMMSQPVAVAVYEAGFLDVFQASMARYSPMETVQNQHPIPGTILQCLQNVVNGCQAAGIEMVQPLLDAGAVDIAISTLTAYQMLGNPPAASMLAVMAGSLFNLEVMLGSSTSAAQPIIAKLRSAGVDSFRYVLDHPLIAFASFHLETATTATRLAALVRGHVLPSLFSLLTLIFLLDLPGGYFEVRRSGAETMMAVA